MQLGLIGLGKMGYNLALNFRRNNHTVYGFDTNTSAIEKLKSDGIATASSPDEIIHHLPARKIIWIMVPAGKTVDIVINNVRQHLRKGDIIIDGGNSNFKDTQVRARELEKVGIYLLDCGTSGGVEGALNGVCAMVGGAREAFAYCEPLFKSIAVPNGYLHCGPSGSGHFVKMVHNGIEYGMMQSIAEGFEVMHRFNPGLDLASISKVWNHGSVVRGWLMELTQKALEKDNNLESIKGVVQSSGEGKWAVETALDMGVSIPVIAMSLLMRYRTQTEDTFAGKLVAALRNEFGGHGLEKRQ
jgi:6-phosphogluconate dehydrogenase